MEFYAGRFDNDRTNRIVRAVEAVAQESGKTMSQVALNWLLFRPGVTAPIIGARNIDQLGENLASTGWSLTKDQVAALTAAGEPNVTYPYDRRAEEQQRAGRELE